MAYAATDDRQFVPCVAASPEADPKNLRNFSEKPVAIALGFDLLMRDGDDLRRRPLVERKAALAKLLIRSRGGIQYVEHAEGHGDKMFAAVCDLGLEGIVSKKLTAAYRSGPTTNWIKVKNPNAPAATRVLEGGF
jgi:ATP-dependent DNA ligase